MSNPSPLVKEIHGLEAEFNAGKISASEYKELLEDIKRIKVIKVAANDLALKSQLCTIIDGLIAAAGAV
jgi:hypothetical protein